MCRLRLRFESTANADAFRANLHIARGMARNLICVDESVARAALAVVSSVAPHDRWKILWRAQLRVPSSDVLDRASSEALSLSSDRQFARRTGNASTHQQDWIDT
ncbi:hypothetical protein PFISCL1PPCAC_12376 [Pristionchus fissidentatus]|uniref:Uncharacterized protein n=1 Tax=Pristionchus fissidentatus TaxID=1538716 RepID=A0AAV5VNH6_9BILA|nr:hypothetical protein PFISCL1PPCAC_12376 [Pristionchus fissidentatus]